MMSGDVTLSPHMQTRNSREDDGKFRVMDLVTFQPVSYTHLTLPTIYSV